MEIKLSVEDFKKISRMVEDAENDCVEKVKVVIRYQEKTLKPVMVSVSGICTEEWHQDERLGE